MRFPYLALSVLASLLAGSSAFAHPGHAVDPTTAEMVHRVASPFHWCEAAAVLLVTAAVGWCLSRRLALSWGHG